MTTYAKNIIIGQEIKVKIVNHKYSDTQKEVLIISGIYRGQKAIVSNDDIIYSHVDNTQYTLKITNADGTPTRTRKADYNKLLQVCRKFGNGLTIGKMETLEKVGTLTINNNNGDIMVIKEVIQC